MEFPIRGPRHFWKRRTLKIEVVIWRNKILSVYDSSEEIKP